MKSITWATLVVAPAAVHTIPTGAPRIGSIIDAQITRIPLAFGNHTPANIVAALDPHAVHAHDLVFEANPAANAVTMAADSLRNATAGALTVTGGGVDGGVQDIAAAQAHTGAGGADVVHAAASPIVAGVVATRISDTTFSLGVATALGDLLTLIYNEVGELVLVS